MAYWEAISMLFIGFALIAYLMVAFEVIRGVLRDRDMPGWAKGAWLVALVVVPFLTAIVYVVVRGRSGNLVPGSSPTQEIAQAKSMWDTGVIDRAEFDALKLKALS